MIWTTTRVEPPSDVCMYLQAVTPENLIIFMIRKLKIHSLILTQKDYYDPNKKFNLWKQKPEVTDLTKRNWDPVERRGVTLPQYLPAHITFDE